MQNDPLYKLRHALAGMGLALLASVFVAAFAGAFIADLFTDSYGARVGVYSALLLYVLVGAGLLFVRVAQHETRPLTAGRLALWLASLWLWPFLLTGRRTAPQAEAQARPEADQPPG
jgi:hypothetical protein